MELIYAHCVSRGTRIALALLALAFLAYLARLAEPFVPLEALPRLWSLPLGPFLAATGAPTGWGWVGLVRSGDYANLAGVAALGLVTIGCYLRLLVALLRMRARVLAAIAALQLLVLVVAASGVLAGAG